MSATNDARASIATGDGLDVRRFAVRQGMSQLFEIELTVVSENLDIDFDAVIGNRASFLLDTKGVLLQWNGICREIEQVRVDDKGLATYRLMLVPRAWLLTQRKNYRIFQYQSELEIVQQLLGEWGVALDTRANASAHKPRKFRVQYGETDFAFASRMLEDAGISYFFEQAGDETVCVLDDAPESRELAHPLLRFHDKPGVTEGRFVTQVAVRSRLRPGKMTIGDLDYRRASENQPGLSATGGLPQEGALEQFDYEPGAFLYQAEPGGSSPSADDRGAARTDEAIGARKTQNRLLGKRNDAKSISFDSDVLALLPGVILSVADHPHRALDSSAGFLVTRATIEAEHNGEWRVRADAVSTTVPYRPAPVTPKPEVLGLESATVVGSSGEEIHTDEYARVRVHFHWDRESQRSATSSCWVPTNQPWAGQGFGAVNLPRIGQEVLVEFLAGDPDRPVVVGRVFTESNPAPDPLPKYKHVAGLMSEATPRLVMGAADTGTAGQNLSPYGGTPLSPQQISSTVTESGPFQAVSPTGTTHAWRGSGMKLDDMSGAENLYIQANRDLHMVVYNNWTTVVGNHRTAKIGTDEITFVRENQGIRIDNEQRTEVVKDQLVRVEGSRTDKVGKQFKQEAKKNITMESKVATLTLHAKKAIKFGCDGKIQFQVRNSLIQLTANDILFQSGENKLEINPKRDKAPSATVSGISQTPEELAAKARAAQDARAAMLAKGAETVGAMRQYPPSPMGGENAFARQALSDAGITNRADQNEVFENFYRRNSLDSQ